MTPGDIKKLPTPLTEERCFVVNTYDSVGRKYELEVIGASEYAGLEQRLAAAVMALASIGEYWNGHENERAMTDACKHNMRLARETLASIRSMK